MGQNKSFFVKTIFENDQQNSGVITNPNEPKISEVKFSKIHPRLGEICDNTEDYYGDCKILRDLMFCAKNSFKHPDDKSIKEFCENVKEEELRYATNYSLQSRSNESIKALIIRAYSKRNERIEKEITKVQKAFNNMRDDYTNGTYKKKPKPIEINLQQIHPTLDQLCCNSDNYADSYSCSKLKKMMISAIKISNSENEENINVKNKYKFKSLVEAHQFSNEKIKSLMGYSSPEKIIEVQRAFNNEYDRKINQSTNANKKKNNKSKLIKVEFKNIHMSLNKLCDKTTYTDKRNYNYSENYHCSSLENILFCAVNTSKYPNDDSVKEFCQTSDTKSHNSSNYHIKSIIEREDSSPKKSVEVQRSFNNTLDKYLNNTNNK